MESGKKEARQGGNVKFHRRQVGSVSQGALGTAYGRPGDVHTVVKGSEGLWVEALTSLITPCCEALFQPELLLGELASFWETFSLLPQWNAVHKGHVWSPILQLWFPCSVWNYIIAETFRPWARSMRMCCRWCILWHGGGSTEFNTIGLNSRN